VAPHARLGEAGEGLASRGAALVAVGENPIDKIWRDRPEASKASVVVRLERIGYSVGQGARRGKGVHLCALAKFICGAAIAASVPAVAATPDQIGTGMQVVDARGAALGVVTAVERATVTFNTGTHEIGVPHSHLTSRDGKLMLGVNADQVEQYYATRRVQTSKEWSNQPIRKRRR
jgi:hypothetical protein